MTQSPGARFHVCGRPLATWGVYMKWSSLIAHLHQRFDCIQRLKRSITYLLNSLMRSPILDLRLVASTVGKTTENGIPIVTAVWKSKQYKTFAQSQVAQMHQESYMHMFAIHHKNSRSTTAQLVARWPLNRTTQNRSPVVTAVWKPYFSIV
jgi:hypothetical protein